MNFPGLDFCWQHGHHLAHAIGIIQTWDLQQCRKALDEGWKVLVVANTALGDTILCTPLLKTLARNLSPQRVGFLVREPYRSLYESTSWVGSLYSTRGKYRGLKKLRTALLGENFRLALIANCTEPDLLPWLYWCGIRGFLRYRTRWSRFPQWFANRDAMRHPDAVDYATGHAVTNTLAMARSLGLTVDDERIELDVHIKNIYAFPEPYFIIHPGASRESKCWPEERWIEIGRRLLQIYPWRAVITGGATEKEKAGRVAQALGNRAIDFSGQIDLSQLAALTQQARLFLSGDTGPYHIGVATGCPTVTLFAPVDRGSSVEACGPWAVDPKKHRTVQTQTFGDPIAAIALDTVLNEVMSVLDFKE